MGQKVNPIGFRIAVNKDWRSRWFADKKDFGNLLKEDQIIRDHVKDILKQAAVSRVQIERFANRVRIRIHTARPGVVFGRKRQDIDKLKTDIAKLSGGKEVYIDVVEIRRHEVDAQLVADSIAAQIERRINFRRAMKKAIQSAMEAGAQGIRVRCAGRLNNAELARQEQYRDGSVPLHTLSANVQYGTSTANTIAGKIGIKVWICLPPNFEETQNANAKKGKAPKGAKRKPRGQRSKKQ